MRRVEDPRLIKGIATYVDDIRPAGLLHASILRSPHAHAGIARIDGGVVAVLTARRQRRVRPGAVRGRDS
jgi:carbon-monoxide dehydrogenase large subunit